MKKLILASIAILATFAFANYGLHEWGREPMVIIALLLFYISGKRLESEQ